MKSPRLALLVVLMARAVIAQYTSGIEGTALDSSGAAIAKAKVVVVNEGTQVRKEMSTNDSGYFRVSNLPPGNYRVELSSAGFQPWASENVHVDADQLRTVYPSLEIGAQKTEVQVTAEAEAIETGRSSVATTIAQRTVEESPLLGRNVYGGVAFIAPGVTGAGRLFGGATGSGSASQDSFQAEPGFQINAAGQRQEANDYEVDGSTVMGNSRDGIANLTPQPDTVQEIRVSAASFTAERARNSGALVEVFSKSGTNQIHGTFSEFHTNNDLTSRTIFQAGIPPFRRNEYGFTLGGPAIKNHTFLFGSFFRLSSSASQTDVITAETPQFVNYLKTYYPNNVSTAILTNAPIGAPPTTGFVTASQLANSSHFAVPINLPGSTPILGTSYVNETLSRPAQQWNTRLDQYLRQDKDRIFFNYYNYWSHAQSANPRPLQRIVQPNNGMFGKVDWTTSITSALVNEASMTLVRVDGLTPPTKDPALPSISVTGMQSFSQSGISWAHVNYNWHDAISWLKGNHNLKFGADIDRWNDLDNFTPQYARPTYTFANALDFAQDMPLTQSQPVIDTRTGALAQNVYTRIHMTYLGLFAQDDWKIRRNLTLNLGLRYEDYFHLAQIDQSGTPTRFFAPGTGSTFNQQITSGSMRVTGAGLVSTDTPQGIMPRIGFGWDVFGNNSLAVRGGYGIFYDRIGDLSYATYTNPPFASLSLDVRNGQTPLVTLGSPNGLSWPIPPGVQFQLNAAGGLAGTPASVKGLNPVINPPTVEVWNVAVEKRITGSVVFEADYIGNHATNLFLQTNVNRYAGDLLQNNGKITRLNPYFGPITFGQTVGYSDADYASFLISKRFSNRFSAKGIYTFGKATDLTSSNDNGVSGAENIIDAANFAGQHGLSDYDVAQRLTIDSVYEIPSPFRNGLGERILGGWQLSGIAIVESGLPFTVYTSAPYPTGDYNADGFNYDLPNTPSFGNHVSVSRSAFINGVFASSAFPKPAAGQEGNLGRNTFTGPGLANVNLNIEKREHIPWFVPEGATIELRGEIFNLFNRVNLTNPVSDLSSTLFGKSTGQNLPRSVTFGLRVQF